MASSSLQAKQPSDGSGAMFDRIAHRYDLLNRLMSLGIDRHWRKKQVRQLQLGPKASVLDLATGTGDVALEIARQYRDARIVGVDPSEKMISIARKKINEAGLSHRITLQTGDAQQLPFADESFDATCISFGIRNIPDRALALCEMARVTHHDGCVAVLELCDPNRGVFAALARAYVHQVIPFLGRFISSAREYDYLQRSIAAFPAPDDFANEMQTIMRARVLSTRLFMGTAYLFLATHLKRGES